MSKAEQANGSQSDRPAAPQTQDFSGGLRQQCGQLWSILPAAARRKLMGLMVLSVLASGLEAISLGLVVPVALLLIGGTAPSLPPLLTSWLHITPELPALQDSLPVAMALLVMAFTAKAGILMVLTARQAKTVFEVSTHLSCRLFDGYLRQPWLFHLQRNSADLISTSTSEVTVATHSLQAMLTLLLDALSLLAICALLIYVDPWNTLVALLGLGSASFALQRFTRRRIVFWGKSRQVLEGSRLQSAQQALSAVKELLVLGRQARFSRAFAQCTQRSADTGRMRSALQNLPRIWIEWICVLGLALLVTLMSKAGRSGAEIGATMALFAATAFRLLPILTRLLSGLQTLHFGLVAVGKVVRDISQMTSPPPTRPAQPNLVTSRGSEIALEKVSFRYPGSLHPALREVDLQVPGGSVVGVIGSTGAGKSTLVDVLLGLLPPGSGKVRVDGVDIADNTRGWQDRIGYVPQHIALIDDSVRRNVAFGLEDAEVDDARLEQALAAAQLQALIRRLPNGLETQIGERGVRLSGGERQRIGLARALYHDPGVVILDEATSALDNQTESTVMDAVLSLRGRKTVVLVAHRLTTLERCDWIYCLDEGSIVDSGPSDIILGKQRRER